MPHPDKIRLRWMKIRRHRLRERNAPISTQRTLEWSKCFRSSWRSRLSHKRWSPRQCKHLFKIQIHLLLTFHPLLTCVHSTASRSTSSTSLARWEPVHLAPCSVHTKVTMCDRRQTLWKKSTWELNVSRRCTKWWRQASQRSQMCKSFTHLRSTTIWNKMRSKRDLKNNFRRCTTPWLFKNTWLR